MAFESKERLPHRGGIPRGLAEGGPAILSYGFRPFFLAAGIFAVAAMVLWLGALILGWPVGGSLYGPLHWHAHELLFGYASAALAGFMLTAIPNWTGRLPVSGRPLALLVALWLAGRIAMAVPDLTGPLPAAIIDGAFFPALALIAGREIVAGRNWKNLKILAALLLLSAINTAGHTLIQWGEDPAPLFRAAIGAYIVLIGVVGGRVVPSFTRNWLARQGSKDLPRPFTNLDIAALAATAVALLVWVALPLHPVTAIAGIAAAALQMARLAGWRGHLTLGEPLVGILHAAYAFIPIGLLAIGLSALGWISTVATIHLLTVGAIGTMTLAIMTRATLGHTGRPLRASALTRGSYAALLATAFARLLAEVLPAETTALLTVAAAAWIAAFAIFIIEYGPMLLSPTRR